VLTKPDMTIELEMKADDREVHFLEGTILTGRGDLLATPYKVPYKEAGVMIFSRSSKGVKVKHEILTKDDGPTGLAFVTEDKLVLRIKSSAQRDEIWMVDAETGEPVQRHDWGTNAYSDNYYGHHNVLHSTYQLPHIFFHHLGEKIDVRDSRQSIFKATSVMTGIPSNSQVFFDNIGWNGVPRMVLCGFAQDGNKPQAQVWDLRKGQKMFTVEDPFCLTEAAIYKNVFLTSAGLQNGMLHIWDLTKQHPDAGGVLRGPTTKTLSGGSSEWTQHHGAYAFDDQRLYMSTMVVSWTA